jgi:hypothetical protein
MIYERDAMGHQLLLYFSLLWYRHVSEGLSLVNPGTTRYIAVLRKYLQLALGQDDL